ncbi:hypothetical protein V5799_017835, partial [Amblyomma americanum]
MHQGRRRRHKEVSFERALHQHGELCDCPRPTLINIVPSGYLAAFRMIRITAALRSTKLLHRCWSFSCHAGVSQCRESSGGTPLVE